MNMGIFFGKLQTKNKSQIMNSEFISDNLSIIDDDTLMGMSRDLKYQLKKSHNMHIIKKIQINLCYVQREQHIRSQRIETARRMRER